MAESHLKPLEVKAKTWYSSISSIPNEYWIYLLFAVFAVNAIILDILFFTQPKSQNKSFQNMVGLTTGANNNSTLCPQSCLDQINTVASSAKVSIPPVATVNSGVSGTPIPTPTITPTPTPASVREYFVPMGVGSGNPGDWTSVDGLAATIDTSDYGSIKSAVFEITIRVPTGNQTVGARLISIGNYATVPGSEVSMSGGKTTLLTSAPLTLTPGSNLYQVQLKTQLQYPAYVDMARIRIKASN